jgi:predicted transposase YbfD/YdcC
MNPKTQNPPVPNSLMAHFESLPDPRNKRSPEHLLIDILVIGLSTLLCGGESFNDMETFGNAKKDWLKSFLRLPAGIPSHDTFNRVFSALHPQEFLECFIRWTESLRQEIHQELVALDGKALRRARGESASLPHIVSAWARENSLVLGQVKVGDKSNEITAVPELLRALKLKGCIVSLDAMGCQKTIAQQIVDAQADYVLALKGNQGTVAEEFQSFLDDRVSRQQKTRPVQDLQYFQTVEKDHGRIETRRYWQTDDVTWFEDQDQWAHLRSVGLVEATRQIGEKTTVERRYYLSSLPLNVECFARAVRGHWSIENSLHWMMDVHFGEDQSRARTRYAAQNLALLRRMALNLIKKEESQIKIGTRRKRKLAAWNNDYLLKLLDF